MKKIYGIYIFAVLTTTEDNLNITRIEKSTEDVYPRCFSL